MDKIRYSCSVNRFIEAETEEEAKEKFLKWLKENKEKDVVQVFEFPELEKW